MVVYKSKVQSTGYRCNGTVQKYRQEKSNWDTLLVTVAGMTTLKKITEGFERWGLANMHKLALNLMPNFGETLGLDEAVTHLFGVLLYLTSV